jgi:hypothetical protein
VPIDHLAEAGLDRNSLPRDASAATWVEDLFQHPKRPWIRLHEKITKFARWVYGTKIFAPFKTHPLPLFRAGVERSAGLMLSFASTIATVPVARHSASGASHRSFDSSDPPPASAEAASADENRNGPGSAAYPHSSNYVSAKMT